MSAKKKPEAPPVAASYELVPIDDVKPHPKNPRKGDLAAIKESIQVNGFYGTLVANRKTREILAGNHRWRAAKELGLLAVPVMWIDADEATERRILLADNRTSDLASYDEDVLKQILASLAEDDGLLGSGYDQDDAQALLVGPDAPGGFKEFGDDIETKHNCPKCGFSWS